MNYAKIKKFDIANGPGLRVSLFVSGCTHRCPGCFNPETWDFKYGTPFTNDTEEVILSMLDSPYMNGLSLLGGEPLEPVNQKGILTLLRRIKKKLPDKNVWCYTGYTLEEDLLEKGRAHCQYTDEILSFIDVLVDGLFIEDLKNIRLKFRGSSNQRIIDMKASLKAGRPVLLSI